MSVFPFPIDAVPDLPSARIDVKGRRFPGASGMEAV